MYQDVHFGDFQLLYQCLCISENSLIIVTLTESLVELQKGIDMLMQ